MQQTIDTLTQSSSTTAVMNLPEEGFANRRATDIACLIGLAFTIATIGLGNGPDLSDHEAIVALGARNIHVSGEWLVPTVNNEAFLRKPPLAFWTAAAASFIVDSTKMDPPVSEFAARLPSALAAIMTVLLVYLLGRSMFGHAVAMLSGLVMACCTGTFFFAHNAQVEMQLTFLMTAAFTCFWFATETNVRPKLFLILYYFSLALAMLAKAPLPLAVVIMPLAVWWFLVVPWLRLTDTPTDSPTNSSHSAARSLLTLVWDQLRRIGTLLPVTGIAVFLLIVLPWPIYVSWKWPATLDLWRIEYFSRYTGSLSDMGRPMWYYVPIALGLVFPFSLSLPVAIASPFLTSYRSNRRPLMFLFTIFVIPFIFLSTAAFKRPHYLVGCIPVMSLLLGPTLYHVYLKARTLNKQRALLNAVSIVLFTLILIIAGFSYFQASYQLESISLIPVGLIIVVGVLASVITFMMRYRAAGLICLVATMTAMYSLTWSAFGSMKSLDSRVTQMIDQLREHDITPEDRLIWLTGRPDTRLTYYYGIETERLFNAIDLAPSREGRRTVSRELIERTVAEVKRMISENRDVYFVAKGRYWDNIVDLGEIDARVVFRVAGEFSSQDGHNDWVVFSGRT